MINILNLDNRYKIIQLLRLLITEFNIIDVYVKGDNISITTSNIEDVDGLKYNRSSRFSLDVNDEKYFSEIRDIKIDDAISNDYFTSEQRLKVELLRLIGIIESNRFNTVSIDDAKKEFAKKLKPGDRVLYKNMPGIITYIHKGDNLKFTINVKDTYYKYVTYNSILPRVKRDLSHIIVPEEIKKLSTIDLLKRLKRTYSNGYGYYNGDAYRAELSTREHIKKNKRFY